MGYPRALWPDLWEGEEIVREPTERDSEPEPEEDEPRAVALERLFLQPPVPTSLFTALNPTVSRKYVKHLPG